MVKSPVQPSFESWQWVVVGPESSGKSTLAQDLANRLRLPLVGEVARAYLAGRASGAYDESDVARIGELQAQHEAAITADAAAVVVDTDDVVIAVWMQWRFGRIDDPVKARLRSLTGARRRYFLVAPDMPWQPDPLREHPNQREELFARYVQTLIRYGREFVVLRGNRELRLMCALGQIKRWQGDDHR